MVVVGAGPTGLAAAQSVIGDGGSVVLIERASAPGGLVRSSSASGHVIDLGGHRLLAASESQRQLWYSVADRLGFIELHRVNRTCGLLRKGSVIAWPFDWTQFRQSTPWIMRALTAASAVKSRVAPVRSEDTLSDWVANRYGRYLTDRLMDPHARKVFGADPRTIPAAWAVQRIPDPSLRGILSTALPRTRHSAASEGERSEFLYPDGGFDVLWSRFAAALGPKAKFLFGAQSTEIVQPISGRNTSVRVKSAQGITDVQCRRIIWTGRAEDLATAMGSPELGMALNQQSKHRDLVVAVVNVHSVPPAWDKFQSIYTTDRGVTAQRFQNYAEWTGLHSPRGVIGLEYSVPSGSNADFRSAVVKDLSILGISQYEILGFDVLPDAYSSFDATRPLLDRLAAILVQSATPIVSTGRQGAGIYINMDQALRLGERAGSIKDFRGVLRGVTSDAAYSKYQEKPDRIPGSGYSAGR